jgi:transporter family protein
MLGSLLGLFSAVTFGVNSIITRRGMLRASSHYISTITVFTGPIFFLLMSSITGDLFELRQIPLQACVFLALSGVSQFALGRTWAYRSIQLIGANRSNIVTSLNPIVTILLAMIVLKEAITLTIGIGILCMLAGPLLILLKEEVTQSEGTLEANPDGKKVDRSTFTKGILYGIGSAIFRGSSLVLIKLGLEHGGAPIAGNLIAYLAASIVILPSSILNKDHREELFHGGEKSFKIALLSGLTTNIAQLMMFFALGFGSAIIVSLLLRTYPIWVLLFSFIFNREYESFSRWVISGNGLIMTGTILILLP